jgi:adenylate cyclase
MRIPYSLAQFILFVLVSISLVYGYLYLPLSYQNMDDKLRDFLFLARGTTQASSDVVIVDIDEKSLKTLGQWPWERSIVAQMLINLSDAKAGIIGLDIIFSEADKTSPHRFAQTYHLDKTLPNYDDELSRAIEQTPTILGYVFNFNSEQNTSDSPPNIPAIFIEKGVQESHYLIQPKGVLTNIDTLQKSSYSSGFINNIPDSSGMIRSVPLVMRYDDTIYSSLAFEMYRIALNAKQVTINYTSSGIASLRAGETLIPTDRNGRLYLNHRGAGRTFTYISACDIVNKTFDPKSIEGKFVLVGTSAYGLMDLRSNPFDNIVPGIEFHASVIDNLLNQDMLLRPQWIEIAEIFQIFLLTFITFYLLGRLKPIALIVGFVMLFSSLVALNYYFLFTHHIIVNIMFMMTPLLVSILSLLGIKYVYENRQKEQVKKKFAQKVSAQVMDDLLKSAEGDSALKTHEVDVTIFFSDIRSFTTISEQLKTPQKLVEFLNTYMTTMAQPIVESRGTIDKFIGDAIMAYWNAPNRVDDHADMAVQAALKQLTLRNGLSEKLFHNYGVHLDFGIGLNSGVVTVGDIGSQGRSDYTIIGDPVNLASRLEGLCKYYHAHLIISHNTKELLRSTYVIRELDTVRVKGKSEPVRIYEILAQGSAAPALQNELTRFHTALDAYYAGNFQDSLDLISQLIGSNPSPLYELYHKRLEHLITLDIQNFDGIYEFYEK